MTPLSQHWCLESEDHGGRTVVRFTGRKIRLGEQHLQIADEHLFTMQRRRDVFLDLRNVECLATTALGKLVALHRKLEASGARLSLCGLSPHLREVLEVTQLSHVLDIRQADALPAPQEPAPGTDAG